MVKQLAYLGGFFALLGLTVAVPSIDTLLLNLADLPNLTQIGVQIGLVLVALAALAKGAGF